MDLSSLDSESVQAFRAEARAGTSRDDGSVCTVATARRRGGGGDCKAPSGNPPDDEFSPAAPANLQLSVEQVGDQYQIRLAWTDRSSNERKFVLSYFSSQGTTGDMNVASNTTSYILSDVTYGRRYSFTLAAVNNAGTSASIYQTITAIPGSAMFGVTSITPSTIRVPISGTVEILGTGFAPTDKVTLLRSVNGVLVPVASDLQPTVPDAQHMQFVPPGSLNVGEYVVKAVASTGIWTPSAVTLRVSHRVIGTFTLFAEDHCSTPGDFSLPGPGTYRINMPDQGAVLICDNYVWDMGNHCFDWAMRLAFRLNGNLASYNVIGEDEFDLANKVRGQYLDVVVPSGIPALSFQYWDFNNDCGDNHGFADLLIEKIQ